MTLSTLRSRPYSLRMRLLFSILGVSIFMWLVSLVIIVTITWNETNDVFDDALKKSAALLLQSSHQFDFAVSSETNHKSDANNALDADDLHYQIIKNGQVISRTKEAPSLPFVQSFEKSRGFQDIQLGGDKWRIYVIRSKTGELEVQVGQSVEMRLEILEELAENLIIPALSLLLLLACISGFTIYYLLTPLNKITQQIIKKSPQDLTLLQIETHSLELIAITNALNTVLSRLDIALENGRHFTADAAHELRTPLAALGMKAQLLQRQHPELSKPLHALRQDIERCTRLIQHLLLLARLDPMATLPCTKIHLTALFQSVSDRFKTQADAKGIQLIFTDSELTLQAHFEMLQILLGNLVDNAIRYCTAGCQVTIESTQLKNTIRLCVKDNGKGATPEQMSRLTQRFYRILGSEQNGSGLGLSIVERIAQIHQAHLQISSGDQGMGLKICVDFPIIPKYL